MVRVQVLLIDWYGSCNLGFFFMYTKFVEVVANVLHGLTEFN